MPQRAFAFGLAALLPLALAVAGRGQTKNFKFADCPVTAPRPTPDSLREHIGTGKAYWNGNLYVGFLWSDSTLIFRPGGAGSILQAGSMKMKYPWFRAEELAGKLTVTGRRLDASAPPLSARIPNGYSDTGFQATQLTFPTEGCWEITGKVGDTSLTFVNRVIRGK